MVSGKEKKRSQWLLFVNRLSGQTTVTLFVFFT
ncbi:hypothetical protein NB724_000097 [Pantoea ananatis]|nr:hypothetical protein [Pantoea ananatis]MCW0333485.1 hypothetical protein [Pantoea ananatis]MCW0381265.1 hypothetical protein [Pantoea ananatis]MCW0405930.1 hypothetical protein [Pantoea ananatis]MCW0426104.1 hypothetical protein [Pantoea ananatis]